jgi:hypothetical protein
MYFPFLVFAGSEGDALKEGGTWGSGLGVLGGCRPCLVLFGISIESIVYIVYILVSAFATKDSGQCQ